MQFKNAERAPLLIVGADDDNTVPASSAKAQFKRYESSAAKTDYIGFEGRPKLHMDRMQMLQRSSCGVMTLSGSTPAVTRARTSNCGRMLKTFR
jgi:hypothetical protein